MINFSLYTIDFVEEKRQSIVAETNKTLEKLISEDTALTFENTFLSYDCLIGHFYNEFLPIYLLSNTSPDEGLQNKCLEVVQFLSNYVDELQLNEKLYQKLKKYSLTEEAKALPDVEKRLIKLTIKEFEKNGFQLVVKEREVFKSIRFKLNELEQKFQQNIALHQYERLISEEEAEGLPDYYKNERKVEPNLYKLTLDTPSYQPFMRYAKSSKLREELYLAYLNRAKDTNLPILKKIILLRQELAALLGYKNFADYSIGNTMAGSSSTVLNFLHGMRIKVVDKAAQDLNLLTFYKNIKVLKNGNEKLQPWDTAFVNNLILESDFKLDSQEVMKYFELNAVFGGIFQICETLFGIKIEEEQLEVWHEDVKSYSIKENGKVLGYFYLDNFPRARKYGHAACFGLSKIGDLYQKEAVQLVALVCNFPKPTAERPSLLTFGQVETIFHEFGHLLHKVLSTSRYYSFHGTNVARDFVEVPSQLFENWVHDYDCLKLFAKHFETGEVFPEDKFYKIETSKMLGSGLFTLQQLVYGYFDFSLHYLNVSEHDLDTTKLFKKCYEEMSLLPYIDGVHIEASFGHLMGYSAAYYGYLWSLVYAEDMFSVFKKEGLLNREVGQRYRDVVLSVGNDVDAMVVIEQFLGRSPNEDAYLESIGALID